VSRTGAECPLNNGIKSGSLPRSPRGITASAPPPNDQIQRYHTRENGTSNPYECEGVVHTCSIPIYRKIQRIDLEDVTVPR